MTTRAALGGTALENPGIFVGVVTTHAAEAALTHGMMAGETKFSAHVPVAFHAELGASVHIGKARVLELAQREPAVVMGVVTIAT